MNNMRQLALAAINFESANMNFPTQGVVCGPFWRGGLDRPTQGTENLSWIFQVLPFMEQQNLANRRAATRSLGVDANGLSLVGEPVPSLSCPSRGARFFITTSLEPGRHFISDYGGYWASNNTAALLSGNPQTPSTSDLSRPRPGNDWQSTRWRGLIVPAGEFADTSWNFTRHGEVGFGSISDGSSNTLLFGEKGAWSSNYSPVQNSRYAHDNQFFSNIENRGIVGSFHSNNRAVFGNGNPAFSDSERGLPQLGGFGSAHPGTFNVALGDGSTHAISLETQRSQFDSLGIRNDGLVIDITQF